MVDKKYRTKPSRLPATIKVQAREQIEREERRIAQIEERLAQPGLSIADIKTLTDLMHDCNDRITKYQQRLVDPIGASRKRKRKVNPLPQEDIIPL